MSRPSPSAAAALAELLAAPLGAGCRPFPAEAASLALGAVGDRGWALRDGDLVLPAMVLHRPALEHNVARMARYCREHGLELAPHGKTTMAPQLFERQLGAGAWAITAATASQAQVMHRFGVRRILIASQVVDRGALGWIARASREDPELELICLVDSVAGVRRMAALLSDLGARRPLAVLVELGLEGRRAGARTLAEAREVAAAVAATETLRLVGVECFEGVAGSNREPATLAVVDGLVGAAARLAAELDADGRFAEVDEIVLSAGGSVFFDRLKPFVALRLSRPVRTVARSGCYVTHDSGVYARASPLGSGGSEPDGLRPALEVWGDVLSRPEPELAIVNVGKRDAPYDAGLPVPLRVARARSGALEDVVPGTLTVTALNDQHGYVRLDGADLEVGDLLACGVSHPCTAFDKWSLIPVVDEELRIVEAIRTFF